MSAVDYMKNCRGCVKILPGWRQTSARPGNWTRRTQNDEQPVSPARVEALLQEAGIRQHASEMQPLAERGMRLSFNEVNFPDLLVFISRLQDEGYARVTGMRVNGLEGYNGLVTAELKLLPR